MTPAAPSEATDNPYPGLRSFRRDETHIFFGREETVSEMVDRMARHRFLAVTGYSGSGKSSMVRVGLLDALDRGMLVEAGSSWSIADFAPGGQPFARLTSALVKAVDMPFNEQELGLIEAKLARGPKGLMAWLDEIDFPADTNLLLLVDQFEEIFRYRQGRVGDDVSAFVQLLLASARQRERPIYVVITMRSDFLGDCARFTGLAEQINDGQFLTPRLTRDQCREAIEGPAGVYDGRVEAELVNRMLNDMAGNPDQLPLMQHILMLMWEEARKRQAATPTLTLQDYLRLGGIGTVDWQAEQSISDASGVPVGRRGALSDHADRVLASLTRDQQRLAERLFRALTETQGGDDRAVRRPVRLEQAAAILGTRAEELVPVIDAFRAPGRNFLTPPSHVPLRPGSIIDITHESLIRQWEKLRHWVAEEHQAAETYRSIERGARQWKRRRGSLLSRLDLAVARAWQRTEQPNRDWAQRYGDAYDLAMRYLGRSIGRQRWRRAVWGIAIASIPVLALVAATVVTTVVTRGLPYVNPAQEWSSFGVEPQSTMQRSVGTNTPRAIPGARVIGTGELERAMKLGKLDGSDFILVDAWRRSNRQEYIPGSVYIEEAGTFGTYSDAVQAKLKERYAELTKGDLGKPLVFFCAGSQCWESYNAALRAINLGYTRVYWYRGGAAAWDAAHRPYPFDHKRVPIELGGSYESALHILTLVRNTVLPSARNDYESGKSYVERQQYDYAVDAFTSALTRDPNMVDALVARAAAHDRRADYALAIADYDKVIALQPQNAQAHLNRGLSRARKGDYDQSIADVEQAFKIEPALGKSNAATHAQLYNLRGNVSYSNKNYQLAIQDYEKAMSIAPSDLQFVKNRANAWYNLGQYDKVIADMSVVLAANAKDAASFNVRGDAYVRKGDDTRAIADFDKAVEIEPQNANYAGQRAYARYNKGDFPAAVIDFVKAGQLSNDPYIMLFRYLSRMKARPGGTAELELYSDLARLPNTDAETWPRPLFDLLLGSRTPEATLKLARTDNNACEAQFYIAQYYLLRGDDARAAANLKGASQKCPVSFYERRAADADLRRLNAQRTPE